MLVEPAFGCLSATRTLRRVLLRRPRADELASWRELGWRAAPDVGAIASEHDKLCALLAGTGAEVVVADEPVAGDADAIYAYDPALIGPDGALLLRIGKPARAAEAVALAPALEAAGVPVVARMQAPATADGGDLFWLDEHTLLAGRGYRTNDAGLAWLRAQLPQADVIAFDLPHLRGRGEVLHLMSLVSPVDDDLAVVYLPLLPVRLVELFEERGIALVEVPDDEFDTMGANVLALGGRRALMLARNAETRRRLERAGVEVLTYDGVELSKGDGGPTCLTRPLLRS
ncbi:MAG: dimethylarginine dimethylaminohydrolase family protein [Gaiellaceae bacterium]